MKTDSVVRARIDSDIKHKADAVFARRGVSASAVIRAFFTAVAETGALPVELNVPNEETAAAIRDGRAGLGVRRFDGAASMFAALDGEELSFLISAMRIRFRAAEIFFLPFAAKNLPGLNMACPANRKNKKTKSIRLHL